MLNKAAVGTGVRDNARFKGRLDVGSALILLGFTLALAFILARLFQDVLTTDTLDLIGVEPNAVLAIERLALTGQLYTDPHAPPFVVLQYGPVFPYLGWAVHRALHLGAGVAGFYLAARLVTCLAMLALMAGVGATLVRFLRVRPLPALVASLLVGVVMFPWGYAIRPDSVYCALGVWALFAFHRFLVARSVAWLLAATALLLCAFYAKQTAVGFLPLLGVAGLLCLRTMTQRLLFLLGAAALAAASVALAPAHFWQNSAVGLANGVDLRFAVEHVYRPLLGRDGIVLAAWLPCLLLVLLGRRWWLLPTALLGAYALAVGTVAGVKWGSDINYYDEFLTVAIMLIAASLPAVASAWAGERLAALGFAAALLCAYLVILVQTQIIPALWRSTLHIDDRDLAAVQRYIAARPSGSLVADLANNGVGVFLPTRIAFASFDVAGSAAATGHLDLAPVHEAIRAGTICYAVTRRAWATGVDAPDYEKRFPWWAGPWAAPVLRDLLPRFEPQAEFGDLVLMRNPVCSTS